jgi:hypothetical protein
MRLRWLASLGLVVLMMVAPSSAFGLPNFGGHRVSETCCLMYGTRADIGSPATDFTLSLGTFGAMRVVSEGVVALIQTGYLQTNGFSVGNNCTNGSHIQNFYEVIFANGLEICGFVGFPGYGVANKYSTYRRNSTDTIWNAAVNGVTKASGDLQMSHSTRSVSGGEINGSGNTNSGHLYGCYGCNGNLAWQRATAPASASWFTIQSSDPLNDDTRWTIGPGASPFTISHPYP